MKRLLLTFLVAGIVAFVSLSERHSEIAPSLAETPSLQEHPISAPQPKSNSVRRFQTEATEMLASLPKMSLVAERPNDDFHRPPPELLESAPKLAHVQDTMKSDADLIPVGMEFFRACASNTEVLEQVRAVCLKNLQAWAKQTSATVDWNQFSPEVQRLAAFLPEVVL